VRSITFVFYWKNTRSTIGILCSEAVKTSDIKGGMTVQYGVNWMRQRKVHEWAERLKGEWRSVLAASLEQPLSV
jgi:hypothetical protein